MKSPRATIVVVMGVSGSGKTTVAAMLAGRLHVHFLEGDDLHPPANVQKMRGGTPLTDDDRWPWLAAIARRIDDWRAAGEGGVVTCSALKRAYRRIIVGDRPEVALVYLQGSQEVIHARMAARHEHFMPVAPAREPVQDPRGARPRRTPDRGRRRAERGRNRGDDRAGAGEARNLTLRSGPQDRVSKGRTSTLPVAHQAAEITPR